MFKDFYYAYIQFNKVEHAKKVLEEYKFPKLGGVVCRAVPFRTQSNLTTLEKRPKPEKNT